MDIENLVYNETRLIDLWNKVLTRSDIQKLAKEIYALSKKEKYISVLEKLDIDWEDVEDEKGEKSEKDIESDEVVVHRVFYMAYAEDSSVSSREEPGIFDNDSHIYSRRVSGVQMDYKHIDITYKQKKSIEVELIKNSKKYSQIRIKGDNLDWVNATTHKLQRVVEGFKPQSTFVRRYQKLLATIFALSIGLMLVNYLILPIAGIFLEPSKVFLGKLEENPSLITVPYLLKFLLAWAVGYFPARSLVNWLGKLWPGLELQLGPEHTLKEKGNRELYGNIISLTGIVSLFVQVIFEAIRGFLR